MPCKTETELELAAVCKRSRSYTVTALSTGSLNITGRNKAETSSKIQLQI